MSPWWLRPPGEEEDSPGQDPQVRPSDQRRDEEPPGEDTAAGSRRQGAEKAPRGRRRAARKRGDRPKREGVAKAREPKRSPNGRPDSLGRIALFCDLENIALGLRESNVKGLDLKLILGKLAERGRVVVKKAYADWQRYREFNRDFHAAGMELIDIPQKHHSGKNSADVKLAVDAMELCYSKRHLDTFVIFSGDGDFSPLAAKLKENNKLVLGIGVGSSVSEALVENCDRYLEYGELAGEAPTVSVGDELGQQSATVFKLMIEAIQALERDGSGVLWGSRVKQAMRDAEPSFSEGEFGYSTFSELLEDAERHQIIELDRDDRSGGYFVVGLARR